MKASETFGVSVRAIFEWKKKLRETGNLERVPLNRKYRKLEFQRTNIVAGYVNGKTIAECVYDCTTDGEVFNAWVEQSLVASL
ncbi:MAG: hypothetical protein LBR91_00340, partial [Puniceicoccales bacterium]|nr:hypothetical protein [Puniceicoccales bacterium]